MNFFLEFEYQVVSALLLASYYLIINTEYEVRPLVSPGITFADPSEQAPSSDLQTEPHALWTTPRDRLS
jgi:hypothetical protein